MKLYDSVAFGAFTMLWKHHLSIVPKLWLPQKNTSNVFSIHSYSPTPIPWKLSICSLSVWIYLFWIFHMKRIIQHMTLLFLASFISYSGFKAHPRCNLCEYFIPSTGWISVCVYHTLFIHSSMMNICSLPLFHFSE